MRERLPQAGTAHRMMLEEPVPPHTAQYNLDGWVFDGRVHALGVVDAVMYPGTQAFMRWEFPSKLAPSCRPRRWTWPGASWRAIGFTHGLFNLEFFHDAATGRLSVIEFNPRWPRSSPTCTSRCAASTPMRWPWPWPPGRTRPPCPGWSRWPVRPAAWCTAPSPASRRRRCPARGWRRGWRREFPGALLFSYPRSGHSLERDYKWLGNWRYGILHLHGRDEHELRERCLRASRLLGWRPPYADQWAAPPMAPAWSMPASSSGAPR